LLSKNIKIVIYRTIILPVVLCGCEAWFLILKEEHRLRVSENKELRKIGVWRKLGKEELTDLYSLPNIIEVT
jgi:hypothetical protein